MATLALNITHGRGHLKISMKITRFCLVRHGETDWNVARRLQGHTDIPLNQHGLSQATQMARALKAVGLQFDVLYSSDLQRAANTALAIEKLFGIKSILDQALRERHLGALQGLTIDEAPHIKPALWSTHLSRNIHHSLEGGESILQFAHRIHAALENLRMRHEGKTILLVSHGGALDMMYRLASQQSLESEKAVAVPNASLNWISHNGHAWQVDKWADIGHLQNMALDNLDL